HGGQRRGAIESAQSIVTRHDLYVGGHTAPQFRNRLDRSDGKGVDLRAYRVDLRVVGEQTKRFPMSVVLAPCFIRTHDMAEHPGFLDELSVGRFSLDVGGAA